MTASSGHHHHHHRPSNIDVGAPTPRTSNHTTAAGAPYFSSSPATATTSKHSSRKTTTGRSKKSRHSTGNIPTHHAQRQQHQHHYGTPTATDGGLQSGGKKGQYPPQYHNQAPYSAKRSHSQQRSSTRPQSMRQEQRQYSEEVTLQHDRELVTGTPREGASPGNSSGGGSNNQQYYPQQHRELGSHYYTPPRSAKTSPSPGGGHQQQLHGQSRNKSHSSSSRHQQSRYHSSPSQHTPPRSSSRQDQPSPPPPPHQDQGGYQEQQQQQQGFNPQHNRPQDRVDYDEHYYNLHNLELTPKQPQPQPQPPSHDTNTNGDHKRRRNTMKNKSYSAGVAEMSFGYNYNNNNNGLGNGLGNGDDDDGSSHPAQRYIGEVIIPTTTAAAAAAEVDNGSKKSKGILSRASKKIKKRLVGTAKTAKEGGGKDNKQDTEQTTRAHDVFATAASTNQSSARSDPDGEVASIPLSRGGRDPSPTNLEKNRRHSEGGVGVDGSWVYSGISGGGGEAGAPQRHQPHPQLQHPHLQQHSQQQQQQGYHEVINAFPSLSTHDSDDSASSHDDESTLSTNFTRQTLQQTRVKILVPEDEDDSTLPNYTDDDMNEEGELMPMEEDEDGDVNGGALMPRIEHFLNMPSPRIVPDYNQGYDNHLNRGGFRRGLSDSTLHVRGRQQQHQLQQQHQYQDQYQEQYQEDRLMLREENDHDEFDTLEEELWQPHGNEAPIIQSVHQEQEQQQEENPHNEPPQQQPLGIHPPSKEDEIKQLRDTANRVTQELRDTANQVTREREEVYKQLDEMKVKHHQQHQQSRPIKDVGKPQQQSVIQGQQKRISWEEKGCQQLDDSQDELPTSFAERMSLLQNSLNLDDGTKDQKKPPIKLLKEVAKGMNNNDGMASTPRAKMSAPSPRPTPPPPSTPSKNLHTHLMAEMKAKLGARDNDSKDASNTIPSSPHYIADAKAVQNTPPQKSRPPPWAANRNKNSESATPKHQGNDGLKRQNETLSSQLEQMKQQLTEYEEEMELASQASSKHSKDLQDFSRQRKEWKQQQETMAAELQQARKELSDQQEEMELASQTSSKHSKEIENFSRQRKEWKQKQGTLAAQLQQTQKQLSDQQEELELASQASSKQDQNLRREKNKLSSELQNMKEKLSEQEEEMEVKKRASDQELRKQERELGELRRQEKRLRSMESEADEKLVEHVTQLASDLEAYKKECASYRERILQKERDHASTEQELYEERKKVQSLEVENKMLLNIAEDNASIATKSEEAKATELNSYREQCEKYRERVLELERKVLAAEGAHEASEQAAQSLQQDKDSMSAQLTQWKCNNETLQTKLADRDAQLVEKDAVLVEKESDTKSLQAQLSTLKTKWSETEANLGEKMKSMSVLESENSSLLQKIDILNTSLEKLQTVAERCSQLQDENRTIKKRNDDLVSREIEMTKEVNDAQGLASNTERLHKMMNDNERFISKLQDDLSQTRAKHLESLQNTRSKFTAEISSLTDKLQAGREANRVLECKNIELEDSIAAVDRAYNELEQMGANQAKSQSDHIAKLMQHADELREKHADCQEEYSLLSQEMTDKTIEYDSSVKELQEKIKVLEQEMSDASESLVNVNGELLYTKESSTEENDVLKRAIKEKDEALMKLQSDFTEYAVEKTRVIDELNDTVQQLRCDFKEASSSRDALQHQAEIMKRQCLETMTALRVEKATLLSDVQTQLLHERCEMTEQVKDMVCKYADEAESQRLEQSMSHSVALSTIQSQKSEIEDLLLAEKKYSSSLEASLDGVQTENQELSDIVHNACTKLSVSEKKSLVDAIDDVLIERSDSRIQVRTMEFDLTSLKSTNANLEYENTNLTNQLEDKDKEARRLESELDSNRNALRIQTEEYSFLEKKLDTLKHEAKCVQEQMKAAFNVDRKSQDKAVLEIISAKEEALAKNEELQDKVELLTKDIKARDEELVDLQAKIGKTTQERQELTSKYNDCRDELASLLDQTVTSKNKAEELMNHYMKIEDGLREQLQSVQSEKVNLERKLAVVQRESDRFIDEFYEEKNQLKSDLESKEDLIQHLESQLEGLRKSDGEARSELSTLSKEVSVLKQGFNTETQDFASTLAMKEELIQQLQNQIDVMKSNASQALDQFDSLSNEISGLKKDNTELQNIYDEICSERDSLVRRQDELVSALEDLSASKDGLVIDLDAEREQNSSALEALKDDIRNLTAERDNLAEQVQNLSNLTVNHVNDVSTLKLEMRDVAMGRDSSSKQVQQLTSTVTALQSSLEAKDDSIKELRGYIDRLTKEKNSLCDEVEAKDDSIKDLRGYIDRLTKEKNSLCDDVDLLTSSIEKVKSSQEEGYQQMESTIEKVRSIHSNFTEEEVAEFSFMAEREAVMNGEMSFSFDELKAELNEQTALAQTRMRKMEEKAEHLRDVISKRDQQIAELKDSLKDALGEALRLGSKVTSEHAKLAELTHAMSSFEEEHGQLKLSLESSKSEVDAVTTKLSSQEASQSDLMSSLKNITAENERLQVELRTRENKLFETMTTLTHFELKLTRAEQERDGQSESDRAEIARLQNELRSMDATQQEREQDLINQIVALKKGGECDELYRELLQKVQDKDTYYNSRVRSMKKDVDSLKEEIQALAEERDQLALANDNIVADNDSLAEEKNRLTLVNDFILSENSSLSENVASLEDKLAVKETETDDSTVKSGTSRVSQIKQTTTEMETTIRAIKKHHSETVKRIQGELDDARKRLKKYERKVKDLTTLLEENSYVIESLHSKLRGKKRTQDTKRKPPRPSDSEESIVTDNGSIE